MNEKEFTLFWRHGKREVITGRTIAEAMNKHYSAGALGALDFYSEGDNQEYIWDESKRIWKLDIEKFKESHK